MVRPSSGRKTQWTTKYEFRGFGRAAQAGEKMLALPDVPEPKFAHTVRQMPSRTSGSKGR